MSFSYTNHLTEPLGCIVRGYYQGIRLQQNTRSNSAGTNFYTPDYMMQIAMGKLDTLDEQRPIFTSLQQTMDSLRAAGLSVQQQCTTIASRLLTESVGHELEAMDYSLTGVLDRLEDKMLVDAQSFNANSVVIETNPTAGTSNIGNGLCIVSWKRKNRTGNVETTQMVRSERIKFYCTTDAQSGGATEGEETFSFSTEPLFGSSDESGSGASASVSVLTSTYESSSGAGTNTTGNLLIDGSFEYWSSTNRPGYWTIDSGTPTVQIKRSTTAFLTNANETRSVVLIGNTTNHIQLSQKLAPNYQSLKSDVPYVGWMCYRTVGMTASTIQCYVSGTGFSSEAITVTTNFATSTWAMKYFTFFFPKDIANGTSFKVFVATGSAGTVYVDHVGLAEMTQLSNGLYGALVRGSTDFLASIPADEFTGTNSNTRSGLFQTFFIDAFGRQMPSKTGAAETLADTEAT